MEGHFSIAVGIIHLENELNFVLESGAGTEGRQEGNEFFEVQSVQHPQQTLRERIDGEFGNGEELIGGDETAVVAIELTEALVQRNNLLLRKSVFAMLLNLFDVVLGEHGRCVAHGFLGKCVYVRERERERGKK